MDRPGTAAAAFLLLFSLPFLGFGAFVFVAAIRHLAGGWAPANLAFLVFGLFFFAVGAVLLATGIVGPAKLREADRRRAEHPNQPWLWRDDWAEGYVKSTRKSNLISKCLLAGFWNVVSAPVIFLVPREVIYKRPIVAVAFLFPLIGLVLMVTALREVWRRLEFGNTSLQLASVPCEIGREFRGAIHARFAHSPEHAVQLKLSCINVVTSGSGDNQTKSEKILWRDEVTLSGAELYPAPTGTSIPVSFHIPADVPQSDSTSPRNSIVWLLTADADVPGVDYQDSFELPVFRTAASPAASTTVPPEWTEAPAHPTILVRPVANGATEFYFPAARNKQFAGGISTFGVIFAALIWFMTAHGAPFIFPLVFSVFEVVLIYAAMQLWMGTSSVVIGSGVLRVRSGFLDGGITREIPFAQITAVQTAITAQQGQATGTPYYDIQLLADSERITLGKTIRDKHEAEWLVSEMKRRIGLERPKAMAAAAR